MPALTASTLSRVSISGLQGDGLRPPLTSADVLALQRTLGNATVNRLLRPGASLPGADRGHVQRAASARSASGPPMLIQRMGLEEFYSWFQKARSLTGVEQRHAFLLHALGWQEFGSFQNWLQLTNTVHEMWGQAPQPQQQAPRQTQQQQASSQSAEGMDLDINEYGSFLPPQTGAMPAQTGVAQQPSTAFQPQQMGFQQPSTAFQPQQMGFQQPSTGFQPQQMGFQQPPMGFQHQQMGFQQPPMGFQHQQMGFQQPPMPYQPQQMGYPFMPQTGYPAQYTGFPLFQPPQPQVTPQQQRFFDLFLGEDLPGEEWRAFKTRDRKYTVNVHWHHILNHTYRYMYTTDSKISHSLFPPRTTAGDIERYIREAIEQYPNENPELSCGTVTVGWNAKNNVDSIVTFFPSLQDGDPDKLDRNQLESLQEHYNFG
jgi:hypothetical protein